MLVMAIRIINKKLNILWPISILKFTLVFMSFTFFSQGFLSLLTIFQCKENHSFISENLKCRVGIWFYIMGTIIGIAIIFQVVIALITASLFFKSIFINTGSDLYKKSSSLPDIIFFFCNNKIIFIIIIIFKIIFSFSKNNNILLFINIFKKIHVWFCF